jgi:hypothetical protein
LLLQFEKGLDQCFQLERKVPDLHRDRLLHGANPSWLTTALSLSIIERCNSTHLNASKEYEVLK